MMITTDLMYSATNEPNETRGTDNNNAKKIHDKSLVGPLPPHLRVKADVDDDDPTEVSTTDIDTESVQIQKKKKEDEINNYIMKLTDEKEIKKFKIMKKKIHSLKKKKHIINHNHKHEMREIQYNMTCAKQMTNEYNKRVTKITKQKQQAIKTRQARYNQLEDLCKQRIITNKGMISNIKHEIRQYEKDIVKLKIIQTSLSQNNEMLSEHNEDTTSTFHEHSNRSHKLKSNHSTLMDEYKQLCKQRQRMNIDMEEIQNEYYETAQERLQYQKGMEEIMKIITICKSESIRDEIRQIAEDVYHKGYKRIMKIERKFGPADTTDRDDDDDDDNFESFDNDFDSDDSDSDSSSTSSSSSDDDDNSSSSSSN